MKHIGLYLFGVAAIGSVVVFILLLAQFYEHRGFEEGKKLGYDQARFEEAMDANNFILDGRREGYVFGRQLSDEELRFVTLPLPEQLEEWNKARGYSSPLRIETR